MTACSRKFPGSTPQAKALPYRESHEALAVDMAWILDPPALMMGAIEAFTTAGHTRQAVAARVRRDHGIIHALLDDLERACALLVKERPGPGALDSFRRAVWDLDITFEEHLDMEEAHVAPILRGSGATGTARAVAMVVEHNEQRRVILGLVEDAESDTKEVDTLVAEAVALVRFFRMDMEIEDRSLAALLTDAPDDDAR